ncbi:hypothetical protein AVEN_122965-1 [Araneus ventricosus]|uniref:Uncharacterized protein n=1 Tax=Araneus ventricosus TaxID=182803 RepID=A0A4Y2VSV7_ARAVE|nr:hypothetical protein AVEN_122965-1 [Araneus ventricosus]
MVNEPSATYYSVLQCNTEENSISDCRYSKEMRHQIYKPLFCIKAARAHYAENVGPTRREDICFPIKLSDNDIGLSDTAKRIAYICIFQCADVGWRQSDVRFIGIVSVERSCRITAFDSLQLQRLVVSRDLHVRRRRPPCWQGSTEDRGDVASAEGT